MPHLSSPAALPWVWSATILISSSRARRPGVLKGLAIAGAPSAAASGAGAAAYACEPVRAVRARAAVVGMAGLCGWAWQG